MQGSIIVGILSQCKGRLRRDRRADYSKSKLGCTKFRICTEKQGSQSWHGSAMIFASRRFERTFDTCFGEEMIEMEGLMR